MRFERLPKEPLQHWLLGVGCSSSITTIKARQLWSYCAKAG